MLQIKDKVELCKLLLFDPVCDLSYILVKEVMNLICL